MMTFLAGPRACVGLQVSVRSQFQENKALDVPQIGYRFALMEIKALVFTLFREIAFELPSPAPRIENGPA